MAKPTAPKLRSSKDADTMKISELVSLIKTHCKVDLHKETNDRDIIGYAKNQLHGIIFIDDNEEEINGKICVKPIAKGGK